MSTITGLLVARAFSTASGNSLGSSTLIPSPPQA